MREVARGRREVINSSGHSPQNRIGLLRIKSYKTPKEIFSEENKQGPELLHLLSLFADQATSQRHLAQGMGIVQLETEL